MQLNDNLGYMLWHIGAVMERQSDALLFEKFGIGYSQFKIMMVLDWDTSAQQKDIAQYLGQTEASISRQIKLLATADLLSVKQDQANRKKHITTLTLKGKRMAGEALEALNAHFNPMIGVLSADAQAKLHHSLGLIHDQMCAAGQKGSCSH